MDRRADLSGWAGLDGSTHAALAADGEVAADYAIGLCASLRRAAKALTDREAAESLIAQKPDGPEQLLRRAQIMGLRPDLFNLAIVAGPVA